MPAIDITPPAAQPAQLPADLLNQMQRGPDQMMQIIQHGNDQRLGLMSQQLQNAMEISRQREQIKLTTDARVKEQQASLDAQAREHAAMMGMDVKDSDTAVSLAPKFQQRNQAMAQTTYNFYNNELTGIRKQELALQDKQLEVFKQGPLPEQQRQALITTLETSEIKPEIRANLLDNLNKLGKNPSADSVQKVVDQTINNIRGEGTYLWGKVWPNKYGTHDAANTAAANFLSSYQDQLKTSGAPLKEQMLQSISAERQDLYKVKQGLMQRAEVNALPIWAAAGDIGKKFTEDFGNEFGGQASTLALQQKLKGIPGIGENQPATTPTNLSPSEISPGDQPPAHGQTPPIPGQSPPYNGMPPSIPGQSGPDNIRSSPIGLPDLTGLSHPYTAAPGDDWATRGMGGIANVAGGAAGLVGDIGSAIAGGFKQQVIDPIAQSGMMQNLKQAAMSPGPGQAGLPQPPTMAPGQVPDATTGHGISNPADAAKVQMAVSLLKHPIGLQAPSDRLLQGTPQEQQAVAAKLAQFDPSGQTAKGLQSMVNGNPQQNQIGTKLINTLLLMQRQNVDPISVIKAQDVRGTPPPGGLGTPGQPSLTP